MKKLLFISKNFPPEIGGGIRRIEAIFRLFIQRDDLECTAVNSVKESDDGSGNIQFIKQRFIKDNPGHKRIKFRTSGSKINLIDKALLGWVPGVLFYMLRNDFDILYATTPPFSNIIPAFIYKCLRFNKPKLIIEYRDFFAYNPSFINNFQKKICKWLEKIIIRHSEYIVVTTNSMKEILEKDNPGIKVLLVRNLISEYDVKKCMDEEKILFDKNRFHLGHIGTLNTGRNPERILRLLNCEIAGKKTSIHFIGVNDVEKEYILDRANDLNLDTSSLFFMPKVKRFHSLQLMRSFDGLILLVNNTSSIKDGYGIPGKLYDYVGINNHIFADIETFNEISLEFDCHVLNKIGDFVYFSINLEGKLDTVFDKTLDTIIYG